MRISKLKFFTILAITFSLFSCEKVQNTAYRVFVSNNSINDIIVEFDGGSIKDTIFSDCRSNPSIPCSIILIKEININQLLPRYTKKEFENKISSLVVYYYNAENEKVYYGGYMEYCREFKNWEYDYSEDDGYGLHEYKLRIED